MKEQQDRCIFFGSKPKPLGNKNSLYFLLKIFFKKGNVLKLQMTPSMWLLAERESIVFGQFKILIKGDLKITLVHQQKTLLAVENF